MALNYLNLDGQIRKYMVEEIEKAIAEGNIYYSRRFVSERDERWPSLLLEAAKTQNDHWLAYQIEAHGMMRGFETARKPLGGYTTKHVPGASAETLAEGQFNRYYMLGLCRRAIDERRSTVAVYRAKSVNNPRSESETLIGQSRDASILMAELRSISTSLGHDLLKPNSGLSVKF